MGRPLPQLEDRIFLADGGLETDLIFNEGLELPYFASIVLMQDAPGRAALERYYARYLDIAADAGCGIVLESPTWRASPDWGALLGFDTESLSAANQKAIELLLRIRGQRDASEEIVISGCVGPRGDGYSADERMTAEEARGYHEPQIASFDDAGADMACAITMTCVEEAIGIARAAGDHGLPVAISFTTETDGRLPSGHSLQEAIDRVDRETGDLPAYYMINCAHPDHFSHVLARGERWTGRIRGLRANASRLSHAELDQAEALDAGDPAELGALYREIRRRFPNITVLGGCCGTDHRHIGAISRACCRPAT